MSRIIKEPEERKKDILDAAIMLFKKKGFEETVVSDIAKTAGIAQGTFYIYYKSKEDVFLAVLENSRKNITKKLIEIQKRTDLNATEKLNLITKLEFDLNRKCDELYLPLHSEKNSGIHQRFIISTINELVPIYTEVIYQGIKEGLFNVIHPMESAEYILVATKFMFDPGIFSIDPKYLKIKSTAVEDIVERILGAKKGTLKGPDINCLMKGEN